MASRHNIEADEPIAEINLIPMIDVALTLLIILMVTTAFVRNPGVALRLPQSVTREGTPETQKDLVIAIAPEGGIRVEGRPITAAVLGRRLRELAARNREARVLVKGDRSVNYSRVMDVMDLVRQAGLTRVVLPTEVRPASDGGE